jgi:hypothetical protein
LFVCWTPGERINGKIPAFQVFFERYPEGDLVGPATVTVTTFSPIRRYLDYFERFVVSFVVNNADSPKIIITKGLGLISIAPL